MRFSDLTLRRQEDVVDGDIHKAYRHERNRKITFILILTVIAAVAFVGLLGIGYWKISITRAITVFFNHFFGNITDVREDQNLFDWRVTRAVAAALCGIGLAIGGVVMQNLLRNPLAEPYTMGISSGALFGVTLVVGIGWSIVPGANLTTQYMANAFVFSLVPLAIILLISMFKKVTPMMMILIGIAVMYLFSSVVQIVMVTASSEDMSSIYGWTLGALDKSNWNNIPYLALSTIVLSVLIYSLSTKLDVMYSGDRSAQSLGLKVNIVRLVALVMTSFLTAGIVCVTGTIGFVGLVAPHVARIFVGSNNRYLMPAAAAFGAAFLIIADAIARSLTNGSFPVGVISSLVGGPLFLYILITQRKRTWM